MCSSDWNRQVSVHWSEGKTRNSLVIVDSDGINEMGIVQEAKSHSEVPPSTESVNYRCQQIAAIFLLFIKIGLLVDHEESALADEFLLGVNILSQVHLCKM